MGAVGLILGTVVGKKVGIEVVGDTVGICEGALVDTVGAILDVSCKFRAEFSKDNDSSSSDMLIVSYPGCWLTRILI